jgi:uncharacterized membrane protein HdeD (DUF308 family)
MVMRGVVGVVLVLVGAVWVLQGLDLLGGSSMTGHAVWTVIGAPMVVVGVALVRSAGRARQRPDSE